MGGLGTRGCVWGALWLLPSSFPILGTLCPRNPGKRSLPLARFPGCLWQEPQRPLGWQDAHKELSGELSALLLTRLSMALTFLVACGSLTLTVLEGAPRGRMEEGVELCVYSPAGVGRVCQSRCQDCQVGLSHLSSC